MTKNLTRLSAALISGVILSAVLCVSGCSTSPGSGGGSSSSSSNPSSSSSSSSGPTVYTAGEDASHNACYWIGTTETQLAGGSLHGYAASIYVSGGTVYTAGADASGNACYWTGTTETKLATGGSAYSIFVN